MSKRTPRYSLDPIFAESLTQLRDMERSAAKIVAYRNDMPQSIDDYKLNFANFNSCAFDGETIADERFMIIQSNGNRYHNSDCASADSQINDFYESLDADNCPHDKYGLDAEGDCLGCGRSVK